jgi:hypothetical protein
MFHKSLAMLGRRLLLSTVVTLVACGSGGGGDGDHQEYTVLVDGVQAPGSPFTAGQTASIDAPSGATVTVQSDSAVGWKISTADVTYQVVSDSPNSKSLSATSNSGGTLTLDLSDSHGGSAVDLEVAIAPRRFERKAPGNGETSDWLLVTERHNDSTLTESARRRTWVFDTGEYWVEQARIWLDGGVLDTELVFVYGDSDQFSYTYSQTGGYECRYMKYLTQIKYPVYVGASWSDTSPYGCGSGQIEPWYDIEYTVHVEAFERISVPAGDFDSLRIVTDKQYNFPGDTRTGGTETCWWAVDIGRNVKCQSIARFSGDITDGVTVTHTETMQTAPK